MSSSLFKGFPDPDELLNQAARHFPQKPINSNLHIHTPHSFSAFTDIGEAVRLAREQDVRVLGISDFNTTEGYPKFTEECQKAGIFPVYCMEIMALSIEDQASEKRWNDPSNPGRIYFCGKGLRYPVELSQRARSTLLRIAKALEEQTRRMIHRMNCHLHNTIQAFLKQKSLSKKTLRIELEQKTLRLLDYEHIRDTMAEGTVRERHIAKALQQAIDEAFPGSAEKLMVLRTLYGSESQVDVTDDVALQNELRSNLLKAGKVAFVEEKPEAYLSLDEAKSLILDMGGIPCYPVLADDSKGDLTDFESDPESLCHELLRRGIYCAEFIPARNDISLLRDYVSAFRRRGIILTAGTEHNTPRMDPLVPGCRGGVELDETLKGAFWHGACVVAAHQYLTSIGRTGYVDGLGKRTETKTERLESIGEAVIDHYLANSGSENPPNPLYKGELTEVDKYGI